MVCPTTGPTTGPTTPSRVVARFASLVQTYEGSPIVHAPLDYKIVYRATESIPRVDGAMEHFEAIVNLLTRYSLVQRDVRFAASCVSISQQLQATVVREMEDGVGKYAVAACQGALGGVRASWAGRLLLRSTTVAAVELFSRQCVFLAKSDLVVRFVGGAGDLSRVHPVYPQLLYATADHLYHIGQYSTAQPLADLVHVSPRFSYPPHRCPVTPVAALQCTLTGNEPVGVFILLHVTAWLVSSVPSGCQNAA